MSVHQFLPPNNYFVNHSDYVWQEDIFSEDELNQIEKIGDNLNIINGKAVNKNNEAVDNHSIRKCKISWMAKTPDTAFIYEKLGSFITHANAHYYDFDLFGFVEDFQYTIYDEPEAHYGWHLDLPLKGRVPYRKLSLVLQLSDPATYEGGNLELLSSATATIMQRKRGIVHLFPSYLLHRVTPVTKGVRKTLVVWVNGNRFK